MCESFVLVCVCVGLDVVVRADVSVNLCVYLRMYVCVYVCECV